MHNPYQKSSWVFTAVKVTIKVTWMCKELRISNTVVKIKTGLPNIDVISEI